MVPIASLLLLLSGSLRAAPSGWELAAQGGYGRVTLRSDQTGSRTLGAFSMAGRAGYAVRPWLTTGLELGGWLLQASNIYDPERGESVSQALVYAHAYPVSGLPLFLRAAAGHSWYTNNHRDGHGGTGRAWAAGAGYELALSGTASLVPLVQYARASISDTPAGVPSRTGRGYEVVDLSLCVVWRPSSGR